MKIHSLLTVYLLIASCVGTDLIDDPEVDPRLELTDELITLRAGEEKSLHARYYTNYGLMEDVEPQWVTGDADIARVSGQTIRGVSRGQTTLRALYKGVSSDEIFVNVATQDGDIVLVQVSADKSSMAVGETLQLRVEAINLLNETVEPSAITWFSDNAEVAVIDGQGLVTALADGTTHITATVDGIASMPFELRVGESRTTVTFMGANGYDASGSGVLYRNDDGQLILELQADFMTSFALGTFIYLSNNTSGSATKSAGLELGEIKNNGSHTFNISEIDEATAADSYQYVIILCKPASITFGLAEINP